MTLKPCAMVGCRRFAQDGKRHCVVHGKPAATAKPRPTFTARGYPSAWSKLSKLHRAKHPLCEVCLAEGRTRPATLVHHVRPVAEGNPALCDESQLVSLCAACHNAIEAAARAKGDRGGLASVTPGEKPALQMCAFFCHF